MANRSFAAIITNHLRSHKLYTMKNGLYDSHVFQMFRSKARVQVRDNRTHLVKPGDAQQPTSSRELYSIYEVTTRMNTPEPPITIELEVGGEKLAMELDTGATFSLISEVTF